MRVGLEARLVDAGPARARGRAPRSRRGAASSRARSGPRVDRVEPHDALVGDARLVRRRLGDEHRAGAAERAVVAGQRERALAAGLLGGAQHDLEAGVAAAERRRRARRRRRSPRRRPSCRSSRARTGGRRRSRRRTGRASTSARPSGTVSRWPVRHSAGASPRPGPARDEARAALARARARATSRPAASSRAPGDRRRPGLVPGRVDRVDGDELAGERDDGRAHEPRMTCVAAAAAAPARAGGAASRRSRARRRGRSRRARTARGNVRSLPRSLLSTVPSQQPRKPSGIVKIAGLSRPSEPERRARCRCRRRATPARSAR